MNKAYRLIENGKPVKDKQEARRAFGFFQRSNKYIGYYGEQEDYFILTGDFKTQVVRMEMGFISKDFWNDIKKASEDLEIGGLYGKSFAPQKTASEFHHSFLVSLF